jgi:hypothetical protein
MIWLTSKKKEEDEHKITVNNKKKYGFLHLRYSDILSSLLILDFLMVHIS